MSEPSREGNAPSGTPAYPPPVQGAPQGAPKKKWSALSIILVVLGSGFVLVLLAAGIGIYLVMSSPKGRAIVGMMGEAVKISAKAQNAPGTKELRAMGCKQAMVMDLDDLNKMMSALDAGSRDDSPYGEMVICSVNPWGTPPTCDDVAAKYVSTVGARPRPFLVSVQQAGKKARCMQLHHASGERSQNFDAPVPNMPE